ncbi:MAG TPA: DUF4153 domain-containing protein [Gemmatimonadales bacterium]|nr:DUF4153 domain-containing protein [Gemmatimonadales bacterium]
MRFPSLSVLAERATGVLRRFPWAMAVACAAAAAAISMVHGSDAEAAARLAMVAMLGIPLSVALTLWAEEHARSAIWGHVLNAAGMVLLAGFYFAWPGPEQKHELIRYGQLSAALHLGVACAPFLGIPETGAFWQYNRRLFLGILRAAIFSVVLYLGLAIALVALDRLFGMDVPYEAYGDLLAITALVFNTWIFLATVPRGLSHLAEDAEYPRVLKVFSQYILTPLVFVYLVILLAYLVKILVGGEWPSGWIGWLVTSVAVAGLLGFLLVHPLRDDEGEGWIRVYARWLFIGLIPAAIVLLVAFWKRIVPYGLTEPRVLGVLLGCWLLVMAVVYTARSRAGIKLIPVSLVVLLLAVLYGPVSATRLSLGSQRQRLSRLVGDVNAPDRGREASAALQFLMDHHAEDVIATAMGIELPAVDWDSLPNRYERQDSVASRILAGAGIRYESRYAFNQSEGPFYISARGEDVTEVAGYQWLIPLTSVDSQPRYLHDDTLRAVFDNETGMLEVRTTRGGLRFDIRGLVHDISLDTVNIRGTVPAELLRVESETRDRGGSLLLRHVNGERRGDSLTIGHWSGDLLVAPAP